MKPYNDLSPTGQLFRKVAPPLLLYGGALSLLYWAYTKARQLMEGK